MRKPENSAGRSQPSEECCRTLYLGRVFNVYECLIKAPRRCPFALTFGDILLCGHPDRRKCENKPLNR